MSLTQSIADSLGVADEGLRLILGQVSAYPLFLFHRQYLRRCSPAVQHVFFAISGMVLANWSIGTECLMHSCAMIGVTWATLKVFQGSMPSTIFLYIFNMSYLLTGYYLTETTGYDISWTMPCCVLCLRMIGLAVDVHDGTKTSEELSKDQKDSALTEVPSILEVCSQSFFVGGYFVGPQFSMRKFQNYIQRNINEDLPPSRRFAFKRFGLGLAYLMGHLLGDRFLVPVGYVETAEFANLGFLTKSLYFSAWVKIILAKYVSAWLLAEGAVILSGLAYNGRWEDGSVKWNGGANVRLRIFEGASMMQHMIDSFNINTNAWVMHYVYKRLRFLNNKHMSQFGALLFLALWHGWNPGYYLTFFNEFLVLNFEKSFFPMVANSPTMQKLNENPTMRGVFWFMGKMYVSIFLPHCFLPFAVLTIPRIIPVLKTTYALVYVFFGTWPVWAPVAKMILKPVKPEKKEN